MRNGAGDGGGDAAAAAAAAACSSGGGEGAAAAAAPASGRGGGEGDAAAAAGRRGGWQGAAAACGLWTPNFKHKLNKIYTYVHTWAWGQQLGMGSAKFWQGTSSAFLRGERGGDKIQNRSKNQI